MAPCPYWKGYLKLSLVSCPVALYPAAARSERVAQSAHPADWRAENSAHVHAAHPHTARN